MKKVELVLPNGHLSRYVAGLLRTAGYSLPEYGPGTRNFRPTINESHMDIRVTRPLQIAIDLARSDADVGITGLDCLCEFPGGVLLLDLERPATSLDLMIPKHEFDHISTFEDFLEFALSHSATIFSEFPSYVRRYIGAHPAYRSTCKEPPQLDVAWTVIASTSPIVVRLSFGSTEGNEFFVDCVDTGNTAEINGCKRIHSFLERSTPYLAASSQALLDPYKAEKIRDIVSRLKLALKSTDPRP